MRLHLHLIAVPLMVAGLAVILSGATVRAQATTGLTQYTFGTPSGDETEILAGINRARANPAVEGQRLVNEMNALYPGGTSGIDLTQLLVQFQSYPARPPLAFNAALNAAAQFHLPEMVAIGQETHYSPNGNYFDVRVRSFGYAIPTGENAAGSANYPVASSPGQVEDNYEIDSTVPNYGHRLNILEPLGVEEVEIGIAENAVGGWNVEDFGSNYTPTLLTGTVFTDNAATGLYVSGEGVASVVVTAPGVSSFYAVTVESGAYTLPLDLLNYAPSVANPTVQVVFTNALGNVTTQTVALTHTVGPNGTTTYTNAQGQVRYDNAEASLAEPGSTHPAFFAGETALSQGVYYLSFPNGNFFGYFAYMSEPHFVYHFDMGYEYVIDAQDGQSGVYLYDFKSGSWFYTSPTFGFPYLYDFSLNSVLYYYPDSNNAGRYNTNGVRYFYDFSTGKIVML